MRLNRFVANATGCSRRSADDLIAAGRVSVNSKPSSLGQQVAGTERITLDGKPLKQASSTYVLLNKPVGYVCSRVRQGQDPTIYDLLPAKYASLKPVGRLDKNSSGLLLLTNNGQLAQRLTHPSHQKRKVYQVQLDKALDRNDQAKIEKGINLKDGTSHLQLSQISNSQFLVTMQEGRNRQIRRTFGALGYNVVKLHRTQFGEYKLGSLQSGKFREIRI